MKFTWPNSRRKSNWLHVYWNPFIFETVSFSWCQLELAWKGLVKVPCFHKMKILQTLFKKWADFCISNFTKRRYLIIFEHWQTLWIHLFIQIGQSCFFLFFSIFESKLEFLSYTKDVEVIGILFRHLFWPTWKQISSCLWGIYWNPTI